MSTEYQCFIGLFALYIYPDINHLKCLYHLTLHQRKIKKQTYYETLFNAYQYAVGARHGNGKLPHQRYSGR